MSLDKKYNNSMVIKYQIELKDIKGLKDDLSAKEKIITKFREEKESLKTQLQWI